MAKKIKDKKYEARIAVGVLPERAMSYASHVIPVLWQIAQQGYDLIPIDYGATEVVRNYLALQLLADERYTHIVMLDIDHVHPLNIIESYQHIVESDPDKFQVVGGLNFKRSAPYEPCVFQIDPADNIPKPVSIESLKPNKLMKVPMVGTGSICIDRRVFEQLKPPWFIKDYSRFYEFSAVEGEDLLFSEMCQRAGIDIWCHTSIISPHITTKFIGPTSHVTYMQNGHQAGDTIYNA